jgi:hypothetical protein
MIKYTLMDNSLVLESWLFLFLAIVAKLNYSVQVSQRKIFRFCFKNWKESCLLAHNKTIELDNWNQFYFSRRKNERKRECFFYSQRSNAEKIVGFPVVKPLRHEKWSLHKYCTVFPQHKIHSFLLELGKKETWENNTI